MRRVFVDPGAPQRDAIEEAATWILHGGVVALPTDTLYGLAANPFSAAAIARLFEAKGRAAERALPLIAADLAQVSTWIGQLPEPAARLAATFWPGPLTLLLQAPATLADAVTGGTGAVGVRVPADAVARAICAACGHPITATSANISGAPATSDPGEVERTMGDRIDLLIDAGPTPGGAASTIVRIAGGAAELVRAGAISWDEIQACLHNAHTAPPAART